MKRENFKSRLGFILVSAGCAIGIGLAYAVIRVVEIGVLHYLRFPSWTACLVSCATGALLSLAVNLIALNRINHLNLTNVSSN